MKSHGTNPRRAVLPLLAAVLAATGGLLTYALLESQEFEQDVAQAEIGLRTRAIVRTSTLRSQHAGRLVVEPATQEDVRQIVIFCDQATRRDVAALREAALRAQDPLVAGNAVRALGRLRAVAGDAEVSSLVHDPRSRVRDETIVALGESGRRDVAAALEPLARDADPKVRLLALRALGRLGGERADAVAQEVLDRPTSSRDERAFARATLDASHAR